LADCGWRKSNKNEDRRSCHQYFRLACHLTLL
jgi:hypothetical protein